MRHLVTFVIIGVFLVVVAVAPAGCGSGEDTTVKKDEGNAESPVAEIDGEDLERARSEAKARLDHAAAALAELQGMGIDTSDLGEYITNAQTLYDNAKTPEEYMGITDSAAYWANVVINFCQEKKEAYLAALAEEEEGSNGDDEVEDGEEEPVDPRTDDGYVKGQLVVKFKQGITEEEARIVIAKHGCTVQDLWNLGPEHLYAGIFLPEGKDEDEAISEFVLEPSVEYAERVAERHEH